MTLQQDQGPRRRAVASAYASHVSAGRCRRSDDVPRAVGRRPHGSTSRGIRQITRRSRGRSSRWPVRPKVCGARSPACCGGSRRSAGRSSRSGSSAGSSGPAGGGPSCSWSPRRPCSSSPSASSSRWVAQGPHPRRGRPAPGRRRGAGDRPHPRHQRGAHPDAADPRRAARGPVGGALRAAGLTPGNAHEELFVVPTSRRGVIQVGPATTVQGDPLGLMRRTLTWTERTELFVHPRTVALESLGRRPAA